MQDRNIEESQRIVKLGELLELDGIAAGEDWDRRLRDYASRRRIPSGRTGWLLICSG